jgi:tetratricopeptide (TPR) repeat protein
MKQYIQIILMLLPVLSFSQVNTDSMFTAANQLYSREEYENAIQLYQTVKARGYESAELCYNLGNAYYKTREYPKAILNYERALLINPINDNIQHNLTKARMYNIDKIDEIPVFIIKRWSNKIITFFSSNGWALISLGAFILSLALLLLYFLSPHTSIKKWGFYLALSMLLLAVCTFYFSYKAKSIVVKSNGAIVMSLTVTVKSSPRETGTNLFIVHEGAKVYIVNQLDNWYEIKLSDGKQGWLLKSDIEAI